MLQASGGLVKTERRGAKILRSIARAIFAELGRQCATNKWWTMGPSLDGQGIGFLLNQILPQVFTRALSAKATDEDISPTADDWTVYNMKTLKHALEVQADEETAKMFAVAVLVTEPLDLLSARLQHLDHQENGAASIEVTDDTQGILCTVQKAFLQLVDPCADPNEAANVMLSHFSGDSSFGEMLFTQAVSQPTACSSC